MKKTANKSKVTSRTASEVRAADVKEQFSTGAVRSVGVAGSEGAAFPLRFELLLSNTEALERLAQAFGEGSQKYGDENWRKGIPEKSLVNHSLAHLVEHLKGDTSEDHLAHACWNIFTLMWVQKNRPDLLDLSALTQVGLRK